MADSPTISLSQTFESLCFETGLGQVGGTTLPETSSATIDQQQRPPPTGRKIRRNSDSVFAVRRNRGKQCLKSKKQSPVKLTRESVESFMETNQQPSGGPVRRRITTRRHTVTEISTSETTSEQQPSSAAAAVPPPPQPTKGCRSQANDVTVDELAGYMENALFIPRPMSTMAEMMYA